MRAWSRLVCRVRRLLDHAAFTILGQRDPASRRVDWVAGNGGHGGDGGQTPPYVPYNPDWDPRRHRTRR